MEYIVNSKEHNLGELIDAVKPRNFIPEQKDILEEMTQHFLDLMEEPPLERKPGKLYTRMLSDMDGYKFRGWEVRDQRKVIRQLMDDILNFFTFFPSEIRRHTTGRAMPTNTAIGSFRKLLFNIHFIAVHGKSEDIWYGYYGHGVGSSPQEDPEDTLATMNITDEMIDLLKKFDVKYNLLELGETEDDYWKLINNG